MNRRRRETVEHVANVLCAIALIVFAIVIAAGWFDPGHAVRKPTGHGCRNAQHCKPVKVKPTPVATPTPVPCPNLCTPTDLTTSWPTTPPVVIVQTFPCPLSPIEDPEPCEPVTTTSTSAP